MNPLMPLFVVVPLAGAFLIMILGRFIRDFHKYFASLVVLFLVILGTFMSILDASIVNVALPHMMSAFGVNSTKDQNRLSWLLESAIVTFEPRLEAVKVSMEPISPGSRMLKFQIEGMLRMDPAPERISFDTVLELTSGVYLVKGDAGTR